ncbi:MAG: hypothetical protein ABI905_09375 [Betaproteobacteria bacterium]
MSEQSFSYLRSPVTWFALLVVVAASGAFYWQGERERTRELLEREREASEQAEIARIKDTEDRRERERTRLVEEIRAQKDAEDAQRQQHIAIRQSETRDKQYVSDDRYLPPVQAATQSYLMQVDQRARDIDSNRQRYEDALNTQRARQEVERQKQYLQQREYEERMNAAQRDSRARYSR